MPHPDIRLDIAAQVLLPVEATGTSAPGTTYGPLSGKAMPVQASQSATGAVISMEAGQTPTTSPPSRQWVRSQGSKGAPSSRAQRT